MAYIIATIEMLAIIPTTFLQEIYLKQFEFSGDNKAKDIMIKVPHHIHMTLFIQEMNYFYNKTMQNTPHCLAVISLDNLASCYNIINYMGQS